MSIRALSNFFTLLTLLVAPAAFAEEGRDAGGGNCGRHNIDCLSANLEEGAVRRGTPVRKGLDPEDLDHSEGNLAGPGKDGVPDYY